ncbi:OmpA family protein [Rhodovulum steppense]|uniref:Outer membrane protein OmpA-like peptidoglycan-associated protein n=1 Tax=Rhodovulum steppense TaxID=540251 RepID=A0A4R1YYU7_9RHOB|nr:OmpA family protein [Rhodovulum steppense]TCM86452.1 outer membrane protein OmpA-like peptidoglycan-associated protein [Rhodovulum steppense]
MRGLLGLALGVAVGWAAPATAQEISDSDLLRIFETQRDAFRAAEESGMGRTRGLTLVTVDDVQGPTTAAAAEPSPAAPPEGGEGVSVGSTGTVGLAPPELRPLVPAPPAAPTPVVFGQLAPDLQVNVRIEFAFDSAALSPDQKPRLEQLCRVMKASDIARFRIVGHTDAVGSDAYNERLSILRAQEVQRYFVNECGIDPARLEAMGLGKRFLFDSANPRAAENRRVEFQALS